LSSKPRNPFNTETGQEPPRFVGREHELEIFSHNLAELTAGKPRHLAIIGGYGIGKTVLLWRMEEEARERKVKTMLLQAYTVSSFKDFYNVVLDGVSRVLPRGTVRDFIQRLNEIGLSVAGSGFSMKLRDEEFEPQSALREILTSACDQLNKIHGRDVPVVLFIDDFQLIARSLEKKVLEILRNVFTVLGREKRKIMLVVSGTPDLFSEFVHIHEPLIRFFEPRELPSLSADEVSEVIEEPLKKIDVTFEPEVIKRIYESSEGNPYFVQLLSHYTFESLTDRIAGIRELDEGLKMALTHLEASRFRIMYESASQGEKKVLYSLHQLGKPATFSEILKKAKENGLKEGTTRKLLQRLHKDKEILKQLPSGQYDFQTKLFTLWLKVKQPFLHNGTATMKKAD